MIYNYILLTKIKGNLMTEFLQNKDIHNFVPDYYCYKSYQFFEDYQSLIEKEMDIYEINKQCEIDPILYQYCYNKYEYTFYIPTLHHYIYQDYKKNYYSLNFKEEELKKFIQLREKESLEKYLLAKKIYRRRKYKQLLCCFKHLKSEEQFLLFL